MRETHSADKWCSNRVTRESLTSHSDLSLFPAGQAVSGQNPDEKISTATSVETERNQQDDCVRHAKVEQDADLPKNTSCTSVRSSKSRRNLTEEEKEARRIRRILANRESARQTIRRRQALCEELSTKAATLVLENENLKREKEQALKEYQSLETTNKHLKEQIAKSMNTETEKAPVVPETSVAEVTPLSGNNPWFFYNHIPATQLVWPPILPAPNPFQLQHTPFNSILVPSNAHGSCSSESESCYKQNNLINDNRTQNPLYMFPCPWLFPLPEIGNGQSPPSSGLKDKEDKLPLGEQCSPSSSLNTVANVDCPTALSLRLKTEPSAWTEARPMNDLGHTTLRFSLDEGDQETGYRIIENSHASTLGGNGHDSAVKQEHEFHLHSASNCKVSSTASYITTSLLEKKQEQFICLGKNPVDAAAAAEARKRRRELTKLKSIHNRQSRMQC